MSIPVRWLTEKLAVAGQIGPEDIAGIADMGFQSVICNRPDHEYGPGQPTAQDIKSAAEAAGLHFAHLPVTPDGGTAANATEMGKLLGSMPQPILAFCRTGNRCVALISVSARMGHAIPQ